MNHTGNPSTQFGQRFGRIATQPITQLWDQCTTVLSTLLADASLK
jgi:hypothetical protein